MTLKLAIDVEGLMYGGPYTCTYVCTRGARVDGLGQLIR